MGASSALGNLSQAVYGLAHRAPDDFGTHLFLSPGCPNCPPDIRVHRKSELSIRVMINSKGVFSLLKSYRRQKPKVLKNRTSREPSRRTLSALTGFDEPLTPPGSPLSPWPCGQGRGRRRRGFCGGRLRRPPQNPLPHSPPLSRIVGEGRGQGRGEGPRRRRAGEGHEGFRDINEPGGRRRGEGQKLPGTTL